MLGVIYFNNESHGGAARGDCLIENIQDSTYPRNIAKRKARHKCNKTNILIANMF